MNINNYLSKISLRFKNPNAEREYNILRNQNIIQNCKWFAFFYVIVSIFDITFTFLSIDKAESVGKQDLIKKSWTMIIISSAISILCLGLALYCKNIKVQKSIGYLVFLAIGFPFYHTRNLASEIYSEVADMLTLIKFFEITTRSLMTFCELITFLDSIFVCSTTLLATMTFYLNQNNSANRILPNSAILLFQILLSYIKTRSNKEKLFYLWGLIEKNRYKNIFENMKSYFLYFSNKKIKFLNHIFVETLMKNKKIKNIPRNNTDIISNLIISNSNNLAHLKKTSSFKNFENTKKTEDDSDTLFLKEKSLEVLRIIFENLKINESIRESEPCDSFLSVGSKNLENFSLDNFLTKAKGIYLQKDLKENFMFLGYKEMLLSSDEDPTLSKFEKKKYEVYFRTIIREEEEYEVIFNDISEIKLIEEKSAELKYKSLFLSKVAHEFKNPLICISELVNELKTLSKSTNKSTFNNKSPALIKQIQSMSDYLLILKIEEIELSGVFDFCKQIAETLIVKNNKKKLDFIIQNNLPNNLKLKTDEVKLKQILINLISNSIKFTNEGCVKLITSVKKLVSLTGSEVLFEIQDSGIGLEPDQIECLGNPFIKGKKSDNSYGTGLGLYIVSQMLKQLDSEIKCTSIIGEGTCFSFSLKVENCENENSDQLINMRNDSSNNSSFLTVKLKEEEMKILDKNQVEYARGLLIQKSSFNSSSLSLCEISIYNNYNASSTEISEKLISASQIQLLQTQASFFIVVDDEKFTRQATLRVLKQTACKLSMNIVFVEAEDGLECLSHVYNLLKEGKKINGIISDEIMHHMNGSTTAEIVKKIKNFNTQLIPFYSLSALTDISNNYVDYFISKPMVEKEAIKIFKK
jgi:signal transduction histidine kinase/CheY-like chemotaxis protein